MTREPVAVPAFLHGGGEMGALIRANDWQGTTLGLPAGWPETLRSTLGLCLDSAFPIAIYWGPQLALLYNDAWRPILGDKHPWGLGRPAREVWPEIWDAIDPVFARVLASGKGVFNGDSLLAMNRFGYVEECYFDYTFNPIRAGQEVAGIFNVVIETTYRVIGARRARMQRDFAARLAAGKSIDEVLALAAASLAENAIDVPFSLLYRLAPDGRAARLVRATGLQPGSAASPLEIALQSQAAWPLGEAARSGRPVHVADLAARFPALPGGPWPEAAREALVLPVTVTGQTMPAALLVAGVSPRRALDDDYRAFFGSLASHMAGAMSSAEAFAEERRRAEALAELDRAKTAFFSNVSHEFRTPLTLMLGPVEDILAKPAAEVLPPNRAVLEVVHRNGQRLLKLVNTLLDFARIEAGRAQVSYQPVDLAACTAELVANFRSACERAGLRLEVDCPGAREPAYVDREMWEKIVLNLLSNAFKFTLQGAIRVSLESNAEDFQLKVSDTGSGISEAELPRMFERFHRVEGARGRSHEGSGIGLALVHELVKLHGGTIGVESELGRGSTFAVRIPKGAAHLPADRVKAAREGASTWVRAHAYVDEALSWLPGTPKLVEAKTTGPRILVADDNADLREYARRLLAEHYEVEAAADGEAALAAARARKPDLVVSDVMMPKLDGFGLLAALRADTGLCDVPVILLSARAGEEARVEGLDRGADDYLVKPFSARELLVRAGALLRSAEIRRQAAATLRESEERFRAFTSATSDVVYRMSADWTEMRQLQGREFIADTVEPSRGWLAKYIHPDDQQRVTAAIQQAIRSKSVFELAHRVIRVDGTLGWTYSRAIPILDGRGELIEWFGAASDVTQRKQAEEALRASEERYRSLLGLMPAAVYTCEAPSGVISYSNEHAARLWGRAPTPGDTDQRFCGSYRLWRTDGTQLAHEHTPMALAMREGREFRNHEVVIERPDGSRITVLVNIDPLRDAQGRVTGAINVLHDVTERKRAEEALREVDRQKDEFIATLSHELRNPLAPLRNSLELLRLAGGGDPAAAPLHEMMGRQVDHLVRLTDDLLEMSRITRGALELRRERVELAAIVRNALETADPLVRSQERHLSVSLPPEPLWVDGDPVRLAQILANLLNNAAKYSAQGGAIAVRARREGAQAIISVRDDGAGIAPAQLPRVFEMFSRGERSSGLGIGLALARRLAGMHGGTVEAASEGAGKGAEFMVRLPLAEARERKSVPAQSISAPPLQKRILVVDDNRDAAQSLGMLLKFLGADVQVAHDGRGALAAFDAYDPGVVLLDIGMQEMDGYEVARRLRGRANGRRVPIIALTGWGQEEDRRRARDAGFDHHLIKPADIDVLRSLLGSL